MFEICTENNLTLHNRSGFKQDDLCTNQLPLITH